jgi:uncharacterized protein YfiM (DUF2279 family)
VKILLISFSLQTLAAPDQWFSADKVQHFFIGTFVQSASYGVLRAARVDKTPAFAAASAFSATVAIGKELRDRKGRGDPSAKDAIWTLAGAAAISPALARTK